MNKKILEKAIVLNDEIEKMKQLINIFDGENELRIQAFYCGLSVGDSEIDKELRSIIYDVLKGKLKELEKELEEL